MRDIIVDNAIVTEASLTEDRGGRDIWEIRMEVPSIGSQYPTGPCRMPANNIMVKKGQQVRVKLIRGKPKRDKAGSTAEWDYWWEIAPNGWNTTEDEPALEALGDAPRSNGATRNAPPSDDRNAQIAWNSAVNNSVYLYGPGDPDWEIIVPVAVSIYQLIIDGPPAPIFPDAPGRTETPVQPAPAPPTRERPQRPPPKSSEEKIFQLEKARHNAEGEEVYSAMDVVIYIASNYQERSQGDLTSEEVDEVIEALISGRVKHFEKFGVS